MARNNQYPIILGMTPPNKQGIGIKSKLGSGYDLYILEPDMSAQYAWIHFCNREAIERMIDLLQRMKELWERGKSVMARNIEYYDRMAKDLYNKAYSDGYGDGLKYGKEKYGQHSRGVAHCTRATEEQRETWGKELWGWRDCGKAIEGRWVGLANFCPWCGRVMEWKKDGDTN